MVRVRLVLRSQSLIGQAPSSSLQRLGVSADASATYRPRIHAHHSGPCGRRRQLNMVRPRGSMRVPVVLQQLFFYVTSVVITATGRGAPIIRL